MREIGDNYLKIRDWRVKENSTVNYSVGGLMLHNNGAVISDYWLNEVYPKRVKEGHRRGDIHIHDLSMLNGYCAGWNLKQLIEEGLGGVEGKITSAPAKHLTTMCNQMVNFLGILQNEWSGAQAFSSFDTYLAPFVKVDKLSYKGVKQALQTFIYGVNTPSRWGNQPPFSNITLDWNVPEDLKEVKAVVGGKEQEFTYGECGREMEMINEAFLELMLEGDAEGRGFQYPIPTYSITKDFNWKSGERKLQLLLELTSKYGTPYFSNYVNSELKPSDIRSMCCRLMLDLKEIRNKGGGGYFGAGENTGSIGVVTLNMPRLGYISKSPREFYKNLDKILDISVESLVLKREFITNLLEKGLYPYTKRYLKSFKNHFSTIGVVGMNEMLLNLKWLRTTIDTKEGIEFSKEVLKYIKQKLSEYQEKYPETLFNLEATPAESTAYRLAKHDKKRYPKIIQNDIDGVPFYTNSSHLPVNYTDDIFSALTLQDELQTLYTSGTVFHSFLGEEISDYKQTGQLIQKIASNYKLPYFTISPTYSVCSVHGYISGEKYKCPVCNKETEVYSRITGYYRPVKNWNDGKQAEFKKRKEYVISLDDINTP